MKGHISVAFTITDQTSEKSGLPDLGPTAQRRRGRPYRLPTDPTPIQTPTPHVRSRLAWLLGVSRLHAADQDLSRRDCFIERLRHHDVVLDSTRLSRWESGQVAVPCHVVGAYERVLGLAPGQLSLGATALSRSSETPMSPRRARDDDPTAGHARLDELFERVLDGSARGPHWIELCELLTQHPHLYLMPDTWAKVADLLATELGRSVGLAYLSRFKALKLLVTHPTSRRHAVRAIGSVVTNPATEFVIHPLSLLQEVDEPAATELLLRVVHGGPGYQRAGAAWAIAGRISHSKLLAGELDRYESAVADIMGNGRTLLDRLDGLAIYAALPEASQRRVSGSVADQEVRKSLDLARLHGELCDPEMARTVAARIGAAVQEATPTPHLVPPDQMLVRLVREALFHVSHTRRHQAALLLSVSPYADQLGAPLVQLATRSDENTSALAMTALFQLARPEHRPALLRLATKDRRPATRVTALMALTQVVGSLEDDEADALRQAMPPTGPLADVTVHVLGMGSAACLAEMADTESRAAVVAWWDGRGAISDARA